MQTKKEEHNIYKVIKEKRKKKELLVRLLYSARLSFRFEGNVKSFTDKQKLKGFSTMNLPL